jgi:hypothetical protein
MKTLMEVFKFLAEETETFSFDELRKYVGITQRLEYLQKTLPILGEGSSRIVFDLGDNVLKVALSELGETQNRTEYNIFKSASPEVKEVLAAIQDEHDENFDWIIMEKVQPLNSEEAFEKKLGLSPELAEKLFGSFCFQSRSVEELREKIQIEIDYFIELDDRKRKQAEKNKYSRPHTTDPRIESSKKLLNYTPEFLKLCLAVPHLESNGGDLGRLGQLGINQEGHLVILDYGFGYETFSQYNPTPYQQANKQAKEYNDFDDDSYHEDEYDKYGNKIIKQKTAVNNFGAAPTPTPPRTSSDIPF